MNFLSVFGHANLDYIITLPKFPEPNTSIELADSKIYFGGPGANIARIASTLGVKTALATFVGENFPENYYSALKSSNLDLKDFRKVKGYSTPTCWLISAKQKQIGIMDQGPMKDMEKFRVLDYAVRSSRIIHITTGRPGYYKKIVELAYKMGKKIGFDPAQEIHYVYSPEMFKYILKKSSYFFASESECKTALKYLKLKKPEEILNFVDVFVLTKGKKGSVIYTENEKIKIPIVKAKKVVDITGAGDGYRAGFYAGLSRNYELGKCGMIASTVASFIVESYGPQTKIPSWKMVLERMRKTKILNP
jgi:sugar/nucleoside kinase (ribokinase family)